MGDRTTSKMSLDEVLAFNYFNKKENCQRFSNMNYFNRMGYTCDSCAVENYRNQDVQILKSVLSQVQSEINKIENNNVHNCCSCVSDMKEDISSLKKSFNNFQEDRQFWLEENKKLKNELEELRKRVENSNEKGKTLNISVTLTDARDLNINISTKQEPALGLKSNKSEKLSLKVTFDKAECEKEVEVSDVKKTILASKPEKNETKHSIKSERKILLNDSKPRVGNVSKNLKETKLKLDEKQVVDKKRIYKSDFLTNVRPKVKDIVHHYHNELRIIPEAGVARKTTNFGNVSVPKVGNRMVHPEIKMFQRQEKTKNVWISENRLVSDNRSSQKSK